ncbi:MAG: hypothetical protein EP315_00295 [Gammaproteobacteria bacterium]|nr:MAG: hypothetical protein EP315_00295 [Gammaproteobacteria bacterium]
MWIPTLPILIDHCQHDLNAYCVSSCLNSAGSSNMQTPLHRQDNTYNIYSLRRKLVSENTNVALVLNWYELKGKNLVGEEPIRNMSSEDILKLFDAPFWNKIYHCWAVENTHIPVLQPHVDHHIDAEQFAYFVEIYRINH